MQGPPWHAIQASGQAQIAKGPVKHNYRLTSSGRTQVHGPAAEYMKLPLKLLQHVLTWTWIGCTPKQVPSSQAQHIALPAARAVEHAPIHKDWCSPKLHDP